MKIYDPNITWAKQKVAVKFQQWDYSATVETHVGGNCKGFEIFDSAVSNVFEELPTTGYGDAHIFLTREDGEALEVEAYSEDDLNEMIVSIEIVEQVEAEALK